MVLFSLNTLIGSGRELFSQLLNRTTMYCLCRMMSRCIFIKRDSLQSNLLSRLEVEVKYLYC